MTGAVIARYESASEGTKSPFAISAAGLPASRTVATKQSAVPHTIGTYTHSAAKNGERAMQ